MDQDNNIEDILSSENKYSDKQIKAANSFQSEIGNALLNLLRNRREQFSDVEKDSSFNEIQKRIDQIRRFRILRISAAAMVVAFLISGIYLGQKLNNSYVDFVDFEINDSIRSVTLIVDDELIVVDGDEAVISFASNDSSFLVNGSLYKHRDRSNLNSLLVPYGYKASIELKDKTKIFLNSGSRLDFPASFSSSDRKVQFVGEAFFNVSKDKQKQFIVTTPDVHVKVYGTEFNVNAYPEEKKTATVLIHGSVSLSSNRKILLKNKEKMLSPGELGVYDDVVDTFVVEKVDTTLHTSWIDGSLKVEKEPLPSLLKKIGRHYDVKFVIRNERLLNQRYSGTLSLNEDLDNLLPFICKIFDARSKKIGNTIYME